MKKSLLIVPLTLAVSACASQPLHIDSATPVVAGQPPAIQVAQAQPHRVPVPAQAARPADEPLELEPSEPLPYLSLTPELMFRFLAAEIAFQRGDWQSGYIAMLAMAQQTRDPRLARRAAEFAHIARQPSEVLSAVRLWRQLAPTSDEANQYFLGFAVQADQLAEVRPILEQRLKEARPPMRGALAFQFQRLLSRASDTAAAFTLLEQLLAPYVQVPEVRLALAQAAFAHGDLDRARSEARQALKAKPDSELAVLTLAQATPEKTEAVALLAAFLTRQPDAREVRLAHARMLVELQDYTAARTAFEHLLRTDSQDLTALYALGVLDLQTGRLESAEHHLLAYLDALERNADHDRDPNQAMLLLAQIAEERKDTQSLLKWLARIDSGEAYVNAQIKRAQLMAKDGDLAGARKLLNNVTASGEREQAMLIMAEAQILRDAARMDDAVQVYKAALARIPENTDLLYDYAMLAEKRGDYDTMEKSLRRIITLDPKHQHAYNALGYSLADRNVRLQEAYDLIRKALELAPNDAFIIDSLGWVQFRLGRLDEAEASLRRAYGMRPDAEIAAHLGEVLWVKGEREAARKLWREAQTRDPQNDTLKSTLARLKAEQ